MSDEWWKCLHQEVGQDTQRDEARTLESRQWRLHFQHGARTYDGTALSAVIATKLWLQEQIAMHSMAREEFR